MIAQNIFLETSKYASLMALYFLWGNM